MNSNGSNSNAKASGGLNIGVSVPQPTVNIGGNIGGNANPNASVKANAGANVYLQGAVPKLNVNVNTGANNQGRSVSPNPVVNKNPGLKVNVPAVRSVSPNVNAGGQGAPNLQTVKPEANTGVNVNQGVNPNTGAKLNVGAGAHPRQQVNPNTNPNAGLYVGVNKPVVNTNPNPGQNVGVNKPVVNTNPNAGQNVGVNKPVVNTNPNPAQNVGVNKPVVNAGASNMGPGGQQMKPTVNTGAKPNVGGAGTGSLNTGAGLNAGNPNKPTVNTGNAHGALKHGEELHYNVNNGTNVNTGGPKNVVVRGTPTGGMNTGANLNGNSNQHAHVNFNANAEQSAKKLSQEDDYDMKHRVLSGLGPGNHDTYAMDGKAMSQFIPHEGITKMRKKADFDENLYKGVDMKKLGERQKRRRERQELATKYKGDNKGFQAQMNQLQREEMEDKPAMDQKGKNYSSMDVIRVNMQQIQDYKTLYSIRAQRDLQ
jgi:hypothetical protein